MSDEPGVIKYRARAKQLHDFRGLRFGNITPTDIDGLIEYQNKAHIFIESKVSGVELPHGQKLALERLCDDLQRVKPTLIIVCEHDNPPEMDIDVASTRVAMIRYKGAWIVIHRKTNTRDVIERFIAKYG